MALENKFKDTEQWARTHRRFAAMEQNSGLMIPTEMEIEDMTWEENGICVWFFQDTSGSCYSFRDRFFTAAASLPPDKFDVRMFCFDTQCYETTLESKKLYGGGGTSFHIIEDKIQEVTTQEKIPYPMAVFVVTDGYGDRVSPEKPENWYWFMSDNHRSCIPDESHVFMLKDYE